MRRTFVFATALLALALIPIANFSQGGQNETSRTVAGGGVSVKGWTGKIDAKEETAGMTLNSARFAKEADAFHIITGPAVTYWNPDNKASGDYTVKRERSHVTRRSAISRRAERDGRSRRSRR